MVTSVPIGIENRKGIKKMDDKEMRLLIRDFEYIARQSSRAQVKQAFEDLMRLKVEVENEPEGEWTEKESRERTNALAEIIEKLGPPQDSAS